MPVRSFTINNSFPPWFSTKTKNLIKEKQKIRKQYLSNKEPTTYSIFSNIRKEVKLNILQDKDLYYERLQSNINNDPKYFWSHVNNLRKDKGIPSEFIINNELIKDENIISNEFNFFFKSNFQDADETTTLPDFSVNSHNFLKDVSISENIIKKHINTLKLKNTAGSDGIPEILLKLTKNEIVKPLYIIYNKCIQEGIFPSVWKHSIVRPVFKKGDKNKIENYRPISLICTFSKLFEKLIYSDLLPFFQPLMSNCQHGFMPKRSTLTNLSHLQSIIALNKRNNSPTDIIYTDFNKAFDSVSHSYLLHKLSKYGITGSLLSLFQSYLLNRSQSVKFLNSDSSSIAVTSGVPQGSVLGPLLFIIYVNDLPDSILYSYILIFADDCKIFRAITTAYDRILLQCDLNNFAEWSLKWKLKFNVSKCKVLSIFSNEADINYTLNDTKLSQVQDINDLGIIIQSDFKFTAHINSVFNKASNP